jgi:hypothetical protein
MSATPWRTSSVPSHHQPIPGCNNDISKYRNTEIPTSRNPVITTLQEKKNIVYYILFF